MYHKFYFDSKVKFIDAQLEDITTPSGAQKFWQAIGQSGQCSLPPRKNENRMQTPKELIKHLAKITSKFQLTQILLSNKHSKMGLVSKIRKPLEAKVFS